MIWLSGSSRVELVDGELIPASRLLRRPRPVALRAAHILSAERVVCRRVYVVRAAYGTNHVRVVGNFKTLVCRIGPGRPQHHTSLDKLQIGDVLLTKSKAGAVVTNIKVYPSRNIYKFTLSPPGAALTVDGAVYVW